MDKWIPCSERLPEEDGYYLVACGRGILTEILWFDVDRKTPYFGGCKCVTDAVAWMPLPQPYRTLALKSRCKYCVHQTDGLCESPDCKFERKTKMTNEEAIKKIKAYLTDYLPQEESDETEEIIEALQQPQWIPCSERVPEDDNVYEVTVKGISKLEGMTPEVAYAVWTGEAWIMQGVYDWRNKAVVAWMPLPKPYEEKEE